RGFSYVSPPENSSTSMSRKLSISQKPKSVTCASPTLLKAFPELAPQIMKSLLFHLSKTWALVLTWALAGGCASSPKFQQVYFPIPTANRPLSQNDSIWVPDQFSTYSIGRYIDPRDPSVMHDSHTLYRREQNGRWNLAPSEASTFADSHSVGTN